MFCTAIDGMVNNSWLIKPLLYDGVVHKVGCHINKQCMNHLFYADDAVVLAQTVDALQKLIDVCQDFARKGDMVYNFEKSECTAFIPNIPWVTYTPQMPT